MISRKPLFTSLTSSASLPQTTSKQPEHRPGKGDTMNSTESLSNSRDYLICSNCHKVLRKDKKIITSQPSRGPSAFIPEKEFGQSNDVVTLVNRLVEEYSTSGRLDNITRVMSLHPQYLESFLRTQFYMLRMDGPLPYHYRHYIAIMAAARHQCSYLINMHVDEFLNTGGSSEWLNGLEYVPQRLKNLNEINKLLAHRPWLITKEHIQVCERARDLRLSYLLQFAWAKSVRSVTHRS